MGKFSGHLGCQAFPGILIDHVQDPKGNSVVGSGLHEIIAPDMLRKERFQPDYRTIIEPQSSPFGLFLRDFQPFSAPDPLHSLVIDNPTFVSQQRGHPAVSVASVLAGQINDPGGQKIFIIGWAFVVSLGGSWQSHHPTGSAF
jgi:hypothetical protein